MCFSFSRIQAARCSVFAPKWTPIAGSLTSPAQNVPPSHTSPAQHPHIPPQKMHSSGLSNPTLTEIHVALKRVLFLHDVQHTWPVSPPPRPFPALRLAIEIFQVCSALLVSSRARAPKTRPAAAADEKKTAYDLWEPCSPGDPNAVEKSWIDVPGNKLKEPDVDFNMMVKSLHSQKATVNDEDLSKLKKFASDFGQDG